MQIKHCCIFPILLLLLELVNCNQDISTISQHPFLSKLVKRLKENISKSKCPPCVCGIPNVRSRIVGGVETKENQYPWMAMLLYGGQYFCGGSLINDRYVLTAAHCLHKMSLYGISVQFLAHNRLRPGKETIEKLVAEMFIHPSYYFNNDTYLNDVALIKLESKVDFDNKKLKPICLPCGTLNLVNEKGMVIGWGRTSENGEIAENLLQVFVPILSNAECESKMVPVVSDMLCAGEKDGGKDACQGDSGGPLHIKRRNKYYQAGIVSFGDGCARPNVPGIYSKVTKYYRWIQSKTRDGCYCK